MTSFSRNLLGLLSYRVRSLFSRYKVEELEDCDVLAFSHNLKLQGAQISLMEILRGLAETRFLRIKVVHGGPGPLVEVYSPWAKVSDSKIRFDSESISQSNSSGVVVGFQHVIESSRPKICWGNTVEAFPFIVAALRSGTPCIWNIREDTDPRLLVTRFGAVLWDELRKISKGKLTVVFNSRNVQAKWENFLGIIPSESIPTKLDPKNPLFLPNTNLHSRDWIRSSLGISATKVAIQVGSLTSRKRPDLTMNTFLELTDFDDWALVFVGEGPDKFTTSLKSKISNRQKSHKQILFAGNLDYGSGFYRDLMSVADLLILPSESEGLPRVLLEARAFSIPSVFRDVAGNTEVFEGDSKGYAFKEDTEFEDVLRNCMTCASSPETTNSLSASLSDEFEIFIDSYWRIVKRLLQSRELGD